MLDYTIARHDPALRDAPEPPLALLRAVARRQAALVAQWMNVGFIHGVMNTDNMSILGLTIDYGPFGFMDGFDPARICNHSDHLGRYAYQRQPEVALWNLFALGQALLPLIRQPDAALAVLQPFPALFSAELDRRMALKLGLPQASDGSRQLVQALLELLTRERTDWTIFWRRLAQQVAGDLRQPVMDLFHDRAAIDRLLLQYQELLAQSNRAQTADLMLKTNPGLVLRNHLAEQAITLARQHDFSMVQSLHDALQRPFDEQPEHADWCNFPPDWASQIQISCSS